MKTIKALLVLLLTIVAAASVNAQKLHPLRKLQLAEMAISQLYVDTVNQQKLVEDAIRGMLKELDPHSLYSTAKETKALNEPLNGSFDGIGVQFNMVEDTLLIIQPVSKGPSEKVGILAGDRIITVADTAISGVKMERSEIMRRLRGPRGSKIKLGIKRRGVDELLYFDVTRAKIPVYSVDAYYMIRPRVGYIRIGSFGATTYAEFMKAVDTLQTQGMRDLIIDLQENGGGYLQAAVKIIEEFLQKKDLIVYTEGRAQRRMEYRATGNGRLTKGKVYVLVNEYSASAAEILAGAMQDQD
ncbi:S41 family peptidase, partial [Prevotella sp.]